jgi:hypothetical protein
VEQLYPFPHKAFAAELKKFPNLAEVVWAQDEPQNQGAMVPDPAQHLRGMEAGQRLAYAAARIGIASRRLLRQALRPAKRPAGNRLLEAEGLHPDQVNKAPCSALRLINR